MSKIYFDVVSFVKGKNFLKPLEKSLFEDNTFKLSCVSVINCRNLKFQTSINSDIQVEIPPIIHSNLIQSMVHAGKIYEGEMNPRFSSKQEIAMSYLSNRLDIFKNFLYNGYVCEGSVDPITKNFYVEIFNPKNLQNTVEFAVNNDIYQAMFKLNKKLYFNNPENKEERLILQNLA